MLDYIVSHFPALLKASWQGGVLILLILAAQRLLGSRLSPRWRYGLWLLVVIRLALPWTVPSAVSLFNLLSLTTHSAPSVTAPPAPIGPGSAIAPTTRANAKSADDSSGPADPASMRLNSPLMWAMGLWLTGAATLAVYLLWTHRRLFRQVAACRPLVDVLVLNLLEDCKQEMGVLVPVTLVETPNVGSPALFGFIRPRLLLPVGLTQSFSLEELRHIFRHELGHIKRHDILMGWLVTGLQIVHWFNPLVWLAFHRMRADRELACDALALSYAPDGENARYGNTIIKLLEHFGHSAWAPSLAGTVETKNQMKERINMIAKFKRTNRGFTLVAALFIGLGLLTLTDARSETSQLSQELIGTWACVGTPGLVGDVPAAGGRIKVITDKKWDLTQTDPQSEKIVFQHGGTWTLNNHEYAETVTHANANTANLVKRTFTFDIKLEGETLTLIGKGNPWKEVWKRVKTDASKPRKSDSFPQGKWIGTEAGAEAAGTCSLTVTGNELEFHGANTNEWYKAVFAVYDTVPKQAVAVITDCPMPEYKKQTTYAIWQLENGVLTLAGNEPGNPTVPANFDALHARKFVFKQE